MKHLLLITSLFFCRFSFAQFAIISDKDGFTNVRSDAKKEGKLVDSLINGHLIYILEKRGNWSVIEYLKRNKELNGFIYFDRHKLLSDYSVIPLKTRTDSSVKFVRDSIEIIVTQKPFQKNKHKFKYYREAPDQIELIDNEHYWGKDGGMPTTEYGSIRIKIGRKLIIVPKSAMRNFYQPNLDTIEINYDKEKNIFYIQSMNSDAAGSYMVAWKIEKGVYKDRLIAYGF